MMISRAELAKAAPEGLPFDGIVGDVVILAADLIDELHRREIWTEYDIRTKPMEIARAVMAVSGLSVSKIQTWVRTYVERGGN
jgi:hypothetical protein